MKMKRSNKLDVINSTVESYLKRRRYQDPEVLKKTDKDNCCSSEEMILNVTAECSASRDNSFVFSAINNDVLAAEQAYQKLKQCILGLNKPRIKHELQNILYPIFCHLYLEMLNTGNRQAAVQFMKTNQTDFLSDKERDFLEELSSVFSTQDIELRPFVNAFRTKKYKVELSDAAHTLLQKFLIKEGHIIIMQVINKHITVKKNLSGIQPKMDETEEVCDKKSQITINGHVDQSCNTDVDNYTRELQEAIRLMQNSAHQSLRIFGISNAVDHASCGILSPSMSKLFAGFDTAEIRLWGIGDTVLTRPTLVKPSITLACDPEPTLMEIDEHEDETGAIIMRGHSDVIHDMRYIQEPEVLLTVSSDKDMRAWRLNDYTCAATYRGHNYPVWCMDTSAFDMYIATGSHDRTAKLWTLDRTFPLRIYAGHEMDVNCIRFHANSKYLATASSDSSVKLWQIDNGNLLRSFSSTKSMVFSLAFSPDGHYLASAGDSKSIMIWDLNKNTMLTELKGHENSIMKLDWSSDGEFIASSSVDGNVLIWPTQEYIKLGISDSTNNAPMSNPQNFVTRCKSILSLRYFKNNSLVCIGTT
ncbi:TAF5-like RNA polymerase II p300/CBP-associated factor-associated factor 65 kDa subunit 5L [Trichogramma pretiosum]|uniref:TAF5-like RNA polymerase II p300/CBP-associated factor-associated factor 65 kDa subunit 5L n=1 Tax=Trichogramma pretiosum TaxID=7493 RepID=UPI0006C9407C|nr:TAF5-like RNA polymerase II p300/CBP-associated factor-associated factor 65 kDa subunit 5L [Trichogramma pretiosum]